MKVLVEGRLLEVEPSGKIAKELRLLPEGQPGGHSFMRNARRLDNGDYLVALAKGWPTANGLAELTESGLDDRYSGVRLSSA